MMKVSIALLAVGAAATRISGGPSPTSASPEPEGGFDYYVSEDCEKELQWEDCSESYWRSPCEDLGENYFGYVYLNEETNELYWVSYDEYNSWESC